jgi:hypothetical protein
VEKLLLLRFTNQCPQQWVALMVIFSQRKPPNRSKPKPKNKRVKKKPE